MILFSQQRQHRPHSSLFFVVTMIVYTQMIMMLVVVVTSFSTFQGTHYYHHTHENTIPSMSTVSFRNRIITQRWASTIDENQPVPPAPIPTSSSTTYTLQPGQATELPDSLADAAIRAAEATKYYSDLLTSDGTITTVPVRCRVDFDTTLGDETFTILKQSTPFVQQYVTALTYALIPQALQQRQEEMMAVVQAKNELQQLRQQQSSTTSTVVEDSDMIQKQREQREDELIEFIANNGRSMSSTVVRDNQPTIQPVIRIYFPDEGSAALARRDWTSSIVPCLDHIEFRSCNGIQPISTSSSKDRIVENVAQIFVCPRASDSDAVERILAASENDAMAATTPRQSSLLSIFINPLLVDMGVTGFGYAGRRLRERLLDTLVGVYYLRTLPNGAMTRQYPSSYTIWQEDVNAVGGYICIANCNNRLPSNPEVIDIFDNYASGKGDNASNNNGGGFLDQLGDFVNGMMRL
jgi:Domain of unknown function (DUF1995)